jgi:hypothetical protein
MMYYMTDPDEVLVRIAPAAELLICPSEEIPACKAEHTVSIDVQQWQTWPWVKCDDEWNGTWAGRFIGGDEDHLLFISGAEFYLMRPDGVTVVDKGPEAEVPPCLL